MCAFVNSLSRANYIIVNYFYYYYGYSRKVEKNEIDELQITNQHNIIAFNYNCIIKIFFDFLIFNLNSNVNK